MHVVRQLAAEHGVCVHPVVLRMTNEATGRTEVIDLPCRATRESKCPACAKKAQKLRFQQCREGWHRDEEYPKPDDATEVQKALIAWRAELEFTKAAAEARADWAKAEADQADIDQVDRLIVAAGLRGRITKPTTVRTGQ